MKTKYLSIFTTLFLAISLVFTSCDKEDSDDSDTTIEEPDASNVSTLTAEEHKENLEAEGVDFINDMDAVANLEIVDVIKELESMLNSDSEVAAASVSRINSLINNPKQTTNLKSINSETISIEDEFANEAGIYEWNETTLDWDLVRESTDSICFIFTVDSETATFTITDFSTVTVSNTNISGVSELVSSINASLALGTSTLCEYDLTAEYYSSNSPKYINEKLTLEGFVLELTLDLTDTSNASFDASFTYETTTIFAYGFGIDGNVDYDAIFSEVEDEEISSDQNIVNQAEAYFQIGNIKAEGYVNANSLTSYYTQTYQDTDTEDGTEVEVLNENIKLYIKYADADEIFAQGEFYNTTESDYYYDYYTGEIIEDEYYITDLRMVFTDGSAFDGSYFDNGFSDIISAINELITEMNTNYDADIETM